MISSVRLHQVVLAAALVVPAALFVAAVWQNRRDVTREGWDAIERTCAIMQEHAHKVLETADLAVGQVDQRIKDEDWGTIASPATNVFLTRLKAPMEQLTSIWVVDRDGAIRAGSRPWAPGSGTGDRGFFQAAKSGATGITISPLFSGRSTGEVAFAVAKRRTVPGQAFDGAIHVAVSSAYFMRFYAKAAPSLQHVATLVLAEGAVLAREPAVADDTSPGPGAAVMQRIAAGSLEGMHHDFGGDGVPIDYAVRQVDGYPAYVVFAVPRTALLQRWRENLSLYGAVAASAAVTLLLVSWLALRRAQAEQDALAGLAEASRQRLEAEQRLRHSHRMDAVGQLTGGIAHDFNNLLTAILGNLELIERAARLPDAQQGIARERILRLSGTAVKAVQRGAALTKSLLAFSRKQPLQPRALDANALLMEFQDLLRQAAGPSVEVAFTLEPGLPDCMADKIELESALLNLVINARDAMDGVGHLHIGTTSVRLDASALAGNPEARPGAFTAIVVSDTGVGMTPEIAAKAFEPFFTTKPIGKGTGLGLSQVYGFVRQLGGHVGLVSGPGAGTVITLYLPAAEL